MPEWGACADEALCVFAFRQTRERQCRVSWPPRKLTEDNSRLEPKCSCARRTTDSPQPVPAPLAMPASSLRWQRFALQRRPSTLTGAQIGFVGARRGPQPPGLSRLAPPFWTTDSAGALFLLLSSGQSHLGNATPEGATVGVSAVFRCPFLGAGEALRRSNRARLWEVLPRVTRAPPENQPANRIARQLEATGSLDQTVQIGF